ncbi:hypothetical protein [Kitasatospora sp. NPDC002040]|uniref:hypothetical protein n=1 Tax=Kitasatospora sp. NPDC002040 TaxID=3154661 RepID=UPI0033234CDF
MGTYLVNADPADWADDEVHRPLAVALDAELTRRGLAPFAFDSDRSFEEKLYRPMASFNQLCDAVLPPHLSLLDWELLLPIALPEPLLLPVDSAYSDTTAVRGAGEVLTAARMVATALALPVDLLPARCPNLDLCAWFDHPATDGHPGPWQDDLDAAFYTALYLRAAEHALREGSPLLYC